LRLRRGRPLVLVDRGPWYPWTLNALSQLYFYASQQAGYPWERNRVEAPFSSLKAHTRRFNNNVNSKGVEEGLERWNLLLRGFQPWRGSHMSLFGQSLSR